MRLSLLAVGSNNTIGGTIAGRGNLISGNEGSGINVDGTGNLIAGNRIGTTLDGTASLGDEDGVYVTGSANTIGGTSAGARNLLSGNAGYGVFITGSLATGNVVAGNYVGTDLDGAVPQGNSFNGILLDSGASNNTIGGTTVEARGNLIARSTEPVQCRRGNRPARYLGQQ